MEHLHPALVHFPIAFYLLETLCLSIWTIRKQDFFYDVAAFVFKAGFVMMWFALIAGFIAVGGLPQALKHARYHFFSALSVMAFATARFVIWRSQTFKSNQKILLATSLILALLVMITGYFGGELVYE